jgi:protein-S-isoprenylcysteine O-methyltransferase Ste14
MRLLLAARALLFVVLFPGTVTIYIPYRLLLSAGQLHVPRLSFQATFALIVVAAGATALLSCVWHFFSRGRGTLAPVDPPRALVVSGLYRYTRNPMYNAVLAILAAQAWLFFSLRLFQYAAFMLFLFHLVVVVYEEPALSKLFGSSYSEYRRAVPRWGFTIHAYSADKGSAAEHL